MRRGRVCGAGAEWELGGGLVEVGGGPPARGRARCEMAPDLEQLERPRGACQEGGGERVVIIAVRATPRARRVCCHGMSLGLG